MESLSLTHFTNTPSKAAFLPVVQVAERDSCSALIVRSPIECNRWSDKWDRYENWQLNLGTDTVNAKIRL